MKCVQTSHESTSPYSERHWARINVFVCPRVNTIGTPQASDNLSDT